MRYYKLLSEEHKGILLRLNTSTGVEEIYSIEEKSWQSLGTPLWMEHTWVDGDYFDMYEILTKKEVDKLINVA